ncbi:MAG: 30S ribosomal protein S17 [Gammaproteobacteria bacterium]|nr:30S ribosomal protein S17 [Gammaproteobacteria bacterium]
MSASENIERTLTGRVVSNKMNKSVTVKIERLVKHPVYGKYIRRSTKLHVHDETNQCQEGDLVTIRQCRPISKTKSWTLVEIVEKAS